MIVYMLFNEITEKSYVGKTIHELDERWRRHVESALELGSKNEVHKAIRKWGVEPWTGVILQSCSSEEELSLAENSWIDYCCTLDPAIGYNMVRGESAYDKALKWYTRELIKRQRPVTKSKEFYAECGKRAKSPRRKEDMSPEEIEFYRQCGRKGAKPRNEMTDEERQRFVEWGKKGARKSKE